MTLTSLRLTSALLSLSLIAPLTGPATAEAAPRFAAIFGDHAVLQREAPVRIWGFADTGETVTLRIAGQTATAKADASGRWEATLSPLPAGGPYELSLAGGATLKDLLVGDVFLCSGQSNMEFTTKYATNAYNEIMSSANDRIRFVTVEKDAQPAGPLSDLPKAPAWRAVGPETTGDTSAVCYYMSKALAAKTGVPIGMIHSSWGGTMIQSWLSQSTLRQLKSYDTGLETLNLYARDPQAAQKGWQKVTQTWWDTHEPQAAEKRQWATATYDDRDWKTMDTTHFWEESGDPALAGFDGVVWYRSEITLSAAQVKSATTLVLGAVDDADTTFINGQVIGSSEGWNTPRRYEIPKGVLKAGRNVIALRAVDTGGGGGMWGDPKPRGLYLSDGNIIQIPEVWKYKISTPMSGLSDVPTTPWLPTSGLATLYNGMIAPIAPYTLKGVAWYQGEANASNAREYSRLLPALFADWRASFRQPDLPVVVVQLANFGPVVNGPAPSQWAALRESQRLSVDADAKTALAVSLDVGDRTDIHPTQKKVVGERVALGMRKAAYGETVALSPEPVSATRRGADVMIRFRDTGGKLLTYSSDQAIGFEACDGACRYVSATVEGDAVVLKGAATARQVRYGWADSPYVNLFSASDLPVAPFQIDIP